MRKTKKQLLGLAGLGIVGIMTAVAYSMPSPDAAAVSGYSNGFECDNDQPGNECVTVGEDTKVQVTVLKGNLANNFTSPKNGETFLNSNIEVVSSFEKANRIDYTITYKDDAGKEVTEDLPSYTPADPATELSHRFTLDASKYGYGAITLRSVAHGNNGATQEDTVTFNYEAIIAKLEDQPAKNGDPRLNLTIAPDGEVDSVYVYVYGKDGKPLFTDDKGNAVPVPLKKSDFDANGNLIRALPFEQYKARNGEYNAVIMAQDVDGELLSMVNLPITYKYIDPSAPVDPDTPEIPDAGFAGFLEGLNITRLDYLLTGLIAFALVAGFALYLVYRKSRR